MPEKLVKTQSLSLVAIGKLSETSTAADIAERFVTGRTALEKLHVADMLLSERSEGVDNAVQNVRKLLVELDVLLHAESIDEVKVSSIVTALRNHGYQPLLCSRFFYPQDAKMMAQWPKTYGALIEGDTPWENLGGVPVVVQHPKSQAQLIAISSETLQDIRMRRAMLHHLHQPEVSMVCHLVDEESVPTTDRMHRSSAPGVDPNLIYRFIASIDKRQDYEEAMGRCVRALDNDPNNPLLHAWKARIYVKMTLSNSREKPEFIRVAVSRARQCAERSNPVLERMHLETYNALMGELPKHASLLHDRGLVYQCLGDYRAALADWNYALENEGSLQWPEYQMRPCNVCYAIARFRVTCPDEQWRDTQKAMTFLELGKAKETNVPNSIEYLETLAAIHAERGEFKEAIAVQQQAVDSPLAKDAEQEARMNARLTVYEKEQPLRGEMAL